MEGRRKRTEIVSMVDVERGRARAKISLGLSTLFAAGSIAWFWLQGDAFTGVGLAALLLVAGYWEYRRRLQDVRAAARAEADAERQRERDRQ